MLTNKISSDFYHDFLDEEIYVLPDKEAPDMTAFITGEKDETLIRGNASSPTLVVLSMPAKSSIPENDEALLSRIFSSIKNDFKNIAWMNINEVGEMPVTKLIQLPYIKYICFGVDYNYFGKNVVAGSLAETNGKSILVCPPLFELETNPQIKQVIWKQLQKIYHV